MTDGSWGWIPAWARGKDIHHDHTRGDPIPDSWRIPPPLRANIWLPTGGGKTMTAVGAMHHEFIMRDEAHNLLVIPGNHRMSALADLTALYGKLLLEPIAQPPPPLIPLPYQRRPLRVLSAEERYARWMRAAEEAEATGRDQRQVERTTTRRVRSANVRRGVLLRSKGLCENPRCPHHHTPVGFTDSGDPLLIVDHVVEHAAGGRDHGINMIALCPNCNEVKTRGRDRAAFAAFLAGVAEDRHRAFLATLDAHRHAG
ncbi:HNH endonuclease [Streptomyces sp. NPDC001091]